MAEDTLDKDLQAPEPHGTGDPAPQPDLEAQLAQIKSESRKWEERAKANKAAADELQKLKESQMTEAEKIRAEAERAKEEAEAAKAEAAQLKAEKARAEAVAKTAKDTGVDAELLALMAGDTPEEIAANAAALKAKLDAMPIYPAVPDGGAGKPPAATPDEILSIKDPAARIKAIAANKDRF